MRKLAYIVTPLLCFVAGSAGFPAFADDVPLRRVWLQLEDSGELLMHQRRSVKAQVSEIWAPYGVQLEWHDRLPEPAEWDEQVLLVHLSDHMIARQGAKAARPSTLGAVMFIPRSDRFLQTIFVSPRAAKRVIARSPQLLDGMLLDALFGQVLGRIVAHELGHILLEMTDHVEDGLMKPKFDAADLLAPSLAHLQLGPNEQQLLVRQPLAAAADGSER